jgi:hypothetical protein
MKGFYLQNLKGLYNDANWLQKFMAKLLSRVAVNDSGYNGIWLIVAFPGCVVSRGLGYPRSCKKLALCGGLR